MISFDNKYKGSVSKQLKPTTWYLNLRNFRFADKTNN